MNPHDRAGASLLSLSFHRLKRHPRPPESDKPRSSVFRPGRNTWKIERASRASFLVDADAFFRAFAEAAVKAERQILIVGWDTDSRTELPRPEGFDIEGLSKADRLRLGTFLAGLARQKPDLRIFVLSWDFAFIYLFERETLPGVKFSTLGEERIRFVLDKQHPFWASHHQKIVVIDDAVAFSGGLDITQRRWDTPEHRGFDERRVDPGGQLYGPFHDVQICVEGDAARALGDLVRERWRLATGETLGEAGGDERDAWPASAAEDMRDIAVGISRTLPAGYEQNESGHPSKPVKEIERLFLDAIRSAQKFIYIENQYFTSPVIAKAIARRLKEDDGPEVVLVLPRDQTGWIEEGTMGLLRSQALRIVEAADHKGRFKAYYPVVPNLGPGYVKVHSKVMIIDDVLVRIGSANLNNRSMGMDTECDVTIEAGERLELKSAIGTLRAALLGEHLGIAPEEFDARFLLNRSLVQTVESFRGRERTLMEMRPNVPEWVGHFLPPEEWIDPSAPKGIRRWFSKQLTLNRHWLAALLIFGTLLGLLYLTEREQAGRFPQALRGISGPMDWGLEVWRWMRSWDAEKIAMRLEEFRGHPLAIPATLLGFVFGSLIFVPITAMILGVALAYPRYEALALVLGGTMLAALATYGLGRYWAWTKSKYLARPWIQRLSRQLSRGGPLAVMLVRLAPVAPFTAVSIVAGGLRVRLRDYMIGTFLGLLPGCLALTLLSQSATELAMKQNWRGLFMILIALVVLSILIPRLVRRFRGTAT